MIAVITCHFNPCKYKIPVEHYRQTVQTFEGLHCIELCERGEKPVNPKAMVVEGSQTNRWLWQKECLLNKCARSLDSGYDKFVFIDADIRFQNPNWLEDMDKALDNFHVVQGFETCAWLDRRGRVIKQAKTVTASVFPDWSTTHPGFVWGFTKDFLYDAGWYPYHFTGGGDTALCWALLADRKYAYDPKLFDAYKRCCLPYRNSVSSIKGSVVHLWHGSRENRRYHERTQLLGKVKSQDIELDSNGLLAWQPSARPEVINACRMMYYNRKEDS